MLATLMHEGTSPDLRENIYCWWLAGMSCPVAADDTISACVVSCSCFQNIHCQLGIAHCRATAATNHFLRGPLVCIPSLLLNSIGDGRHGSLGTLGRERDHQPS